MSGQWSTTYDTEGNFVEVVHYPNAIPDTYQTPAQHAETLAYEALADELNSRAQQYDGRMYVTPEKPESHGVLGCIVVLAIVAAVIFLAGWV